MIVGKLLMGGFPQKAAGTQPAVIDALICANNDSAVVSTLPLPLRCTRDGEDGACDQLGIVNRRSVPEAGQDGEGRVGGPIGEYHCVVLRAEG
jgi:hypothetical protein